MTGASRLIVNADDFGLSSPINEAVLEAAERGILTSATIMANMPAFDEAVRGAKDHPRLGVGVHLNLLRGWPLSPPSEIRSLLGRDGKLLGSASAFAWRLWLRKIDPAHLERECLAQVERVKAAGLRPTHLDSEKHLHLAFPLLGEIACRVANRTGVRCIRVARESHAFRVRVRTPKVQAAKALFLTRQSFRFAAVARSYSLRFADHFFGIALTGRMIVDVYRTLFQSLPAGSIEIMTHPAAGEGAAAAAGEHSWLDRQRVAEYRALLDPATKEALAASGAQLITYGQL
jgi:predicted glycoside hydrolase/deacetylase ChbG (UPF0249 family)